jgi:hypothetical protein
MYLFAVGVAFLLGVVFRDGDGVSFLPTVLLTTPWFFVPAVVPPPHWLFAALTALYDFPIFLISASLNVLLGSLVCRRFSSKNSLGIPSITSPPSSTE